MNTSLPTNIGRYRVDRVLATGATSSVFAAHDAELDTPVAIKVLAEHLASRADVVQQFLAQARTLRAMTDPRIVAVHDIGTTERGQPYFVMDLVDGGSLAHRLRDAGTRPTRARIDDVLAIGPELGAALAAVHRHGVVHGDVKPENVFVADAGASDAPLPPGGRLVLGDLTGALGSNAPAAGTPGYMAPEQQTGGRVDARTDLYAATALVVRVLTGSPPVPGRVPRLSGAAARFDGFVASGLAVDPAARPADAAAWVRALERSRRSSRSIAVVAAASIAVLAVLVAAFVLTRDGGDVRPVVLAAGDEVQRVGPGGSVVELADAAQLGFAPADATDSSGRTLAVDTAGNRIVRVTDGRGAGTFAGTGTAGDSGDGGPAASAEFNRPRAIAARGDRVAVADTVNNRVRAIDGRGVVRTVAGTGQPGSEGDGGPATSASVGAPIAVAFGNDGAVYVIGSGSNRVRAFRPGGNIRTVAGTGTGGYRGDGGPATQAELRDPSGIAVTDDGALWIADTGNERLRRVDRAGVVRTVARFAGNPPVAVRALGDRVVIVQRDGALARVRSNGDVERVS